MKIINAKIHGLLDYIVAIALIVYPMMQNFSLVSPLAFYIPVIAGIALFLYSLITDYSMSVQKMLPFDVHLKIDFIAAVALILTPIIFGFEGTVKMFMWVIGIAVILVVFLTDAESA